MRSAGVSEYGCLEEQALSETPIYVEQKERAWKCAISQFGCGKLFYSGRDL